MIKAILDTCFIEKFHKSGKISNDFDILIKEAKFELYLHPYVYRKEMDAFSYIDTLIRNGVVKVSEYEDFIAPDFKQYYLDLYLQIYNDFYYRLLASNPIKAEKMHELDENTDIFEYRYSGSSMGDVHIIMMALFMEIPIILSQDNKDMLEIYNIAKHKINSDNYLLEIYTIENVVNYIKENEHEISNKELKRIKRAYD